MNLSVELEASTTDLVTLAKQASITCQEELDGANALLQDVKAMQKQILNFFNPHVARANEAHKALTMDRAKFLEPLLLAEEQLKDVSKKYLDVQRQKAEAERARLEEKARKKEEARRKVEAEHMREEAEQLRKAGQAKAAKAVEAEAKAIVAAPIQFFEPVYVAAPVVPKGMTVTVRWGYKVVDFSKIPSEYLEVNDKLLSKVAAAMKDRLSIPGIEAVKIDGISSRGA